MIYFVTNKMDGSHQLVITLYIRIGRASKNKVNCYRFEKLDKIKTCGLEENRYIMNNKLKVL